MQISTTCLLICVLESAQDSLMRTLVSNTVENVGVPVLLQHPPPSLQMQIAVSSAQATNSNTAVQATDLSCIN
jgi:hypothetical protein